MSRGEPITIEMAKVVINKEYIEMRRPLFEHHVEELKRKDFSTLTEALLDLMVGLCVIEYNGKNIERKMNPLLGREFYTDEEFLEVYNFSK